MTSIPYILINAIVLLEVCGWALSWWMMNFFFNCRLFFSNAREQSFQNLTIILRIDPLFLSLTSGWDHMFINDSTFVKKKNYEHHFANRFSLMDLLQWRSWGPPGYTFLLCFRVMMIGPHFIACDDTGYERQVISIFVFQMCAESTCWSWYFVKCCGIHIESTCHILSFFIMFLIVDFEQSIVTTISRQVRTIFFN